MINLHRWLYLIFLVPGFLAAQDIGKEYKYYVSSIGWHTAIVIPASDFPDSLWTNNYDFSDALFLEIGWGEADYFPSENFNIWYAFKSVFWPTSSVLHINPINRPLEEYYNDTNVVRMEVSREGHQRLIRFLKEGFKLDVNGEIIPVAVGKYPNSHFFKGNEKYFFPKNSNVWAARALKNSGYSINPLWYQTTGCVLKKAQDLGDKGIVKY